MKHILIICILILSACNQTKKGIGQIVKTDTVYITKGNQLDITLNMDSVMDIAPKGFACFNQPRVFIKWPTCHSSRLYRHRTYSQRF